MKQSFCKLTVLLSIFALISTVPVQAMSMPRFSMPSISSFNLSALKTPEAVSNALSRLSSAFRLLSPKTLASIVETQGKKFKENMNAYIENPSLAKGGKAAANALAATAAALALAGETAIGYYAVTGAATVGAGLAQREIKSLQETPAGTLRQIAEEAATLQSPFGRPME